METEFYADKAGQWRWRVKTSKGDILAASTEGFESYAECLDDHEHVLALGARLVRPWLYAVIGFFTGVLVTLVTTLIAMG